MCGLVTGQEMESTSENKKMYVSVQKELTEEREGQEEHSKENEGAAMEEKRGEAPLGCNYKSLNPVCCWPPEHEREEEEEDEKEEEEEEEEEDEEEEEEEEGRDVDADAMRGASRTQGRGVPQGEEAKKKGRRSERGQWKKRKLLTTAE